MAKEKKLDRRQVLKLGMGLAAGTAISASVLGKFKNDDPHCSVTPHQELGPFPPMKFRTQADHDIDLTHVAGKTGKAAGKIIRVEGSIMDADCKPVRDAVVEVWQANHYGKYNHEFDPNGTDDPFFQGWAQAVTNEKGKYSFTTVLPGIYGRRTRHIHFKVARRGFHELVTQLYFDGEERNKTDALLNALTHEEQMQVIRKLEDATNLPLIRFDIHLDPVLPGVLPEKVLKEYAGRYQIEVKGTPVEEFINTMLGGPYDPVVMEVQHEGVQLFMTLPFAPKTEVIWQEKDVFDARSFYHSQLRFVRNEAGVVHAVEILSGKGTIQGKKLEHQ
jgi:protocatechuate 3,4-dioxygenase beta subunit